MSDKIAYTIAAAILISFVSLSIIAYKTQPQAPTIRELYDAYYQVNELEESR